MKNSRTSLNKPFYDWIKEVREADKKIAELEEKLYYYNIKLIGYNSPNFEPRLSSTKPEYKDNRYIWIEKIDMLENLIKMHIKILNEYNEFKKEMKKQEINILNTHIFNKKEYHGFTKSYRYKILNNIAIKYNKYKEKSLY